MRTMLQPIKKTLVSSACLSAYAAVLALSFSGTPALAQVAAPGTAAVKPGAAAALAPGSGPSYDNRWDVYGGINLMNGQAGQNLPKRYNMGGGEAQVTYWLTHKFGVAGDYRFEAGTTPVISPYYNRVLVMQSIYSGGVQYRGPRNRYAAVNFHAFGGEASGTFDYAVQHYPGGSPVSSCPANQQPGQQGNLGLYCNHSTPWGAAGGSLDFNQGKRLAIRLSPDMIFEHYGTETREYFAISLGALYRFGRK